MPCAELRKLDFLIGDGPGSGTLFPPIHEPISFHGHLSIQREACERYLRMEFFGLVPNVGVESIHAVLSYSRKLQAYRMWNFVSSQEEPLIMTGKLEGSSLVMVSEPTEMIWGLQKMRARFQAPEEGVLHYFAELWTIDGYTPYCEASYQLHSLNVF